MDLNFSDEEEEFRAEVREFLNAKLSPAISEKVRLGRRLSKADHEAWHAVLNEQGWLASHWPVEHGGQGWGVVQNFIFALETALANAPRIVPFAISMLGPVLIKYGNDAQKIHWLPRILNGSDWWCQGYSEPCAGSDLASLKTSAVRGSDADGDHYIVNGQKTWTTYGQHANMIFCLVRTSTEGRKQQGISFLLIDMTSPGVEVRPIVLLDGKPEVNEVFFDNVRVPAENLVGEENMGWTYAKYLLSYERTNIANVGGSMAALENLRTICRSQLRNGRPLAEDPLFAARLARLEIDLENMRTTNLRMLTAAAGAAAPLELGAMLKIRGTEIRQEISSLTRRALGPFARPFLSDVLDGVMNDDAICPEYAPGAAVNYFNNRKLSIYGGSNEIQREIIAKTALGL